MGITGTMAVSITADYQDSTDDWRQAGKIRAWQSCVWGKDYGKWSDGKDARSFWNWLYKWMIQIKNLHVFGWEMWQNWCLLDGIKEITDGRLSLDITRDCFIAADLPTIITCTALKGKMIWSDLGNLGINKSDYDVSDDRAVLPAAKIAVKDFRAMCREHDMGGMCLTAASQAWHIYSRRYETPPQSSSSILAMEETAYFGGRCRCYRLGEISERLYRLDVSSMYTAIGLNALFPGEFECVWNHGDSDKPSMSTNLLAIADVTLQTDAAYYPARGRVRVNGLQKPELGDYGERVIYPVGTYRTILCGPELSLAIANDHIREWHRVQYYSAEPLMKKWSQWALAAREKIRNDQKLRRLHGCFKRIINSLPGKWCQYNETWVDCPQFDGDVADWHKEYARNPHTGQMTLFRTVAGRCQYKENTQLAEHAHPAIAAFWTSYGRAMLTGLTSMLGLDDLFYEDTDEVIVNADGLKLLSDKVGISETAEPGRLRILGMADHAHFVGLRKYFFGGEPHWAGVMPGEEEEGNLNEQMWRGRVGKASKQTEASRWNDYKHGDVTDEGIVYPYVIGKP